MDNQQNQDQVGGFNTIGFSISMAVMVLMLLVNFYYRKNESMGFLMILGAFSGGFVGAFASSDGSNAMIGGMFLVGLMVAGLLNVLAVNVMRG